MSIANVQRRPFHCAFSALTAAVLASLAMLSACGGGGDDALAPVAAAPVNTLAGTVAVGAPITNGKLRILDATGAVVAADIAIAADGSYPRITLTGPAPYRLEACGYAGPNYLCVYSVADAGGTANVTPLTTATVVLASGKDPAASMSGAASGLTAAEVAAAQAQLQATLAAIMASAGISGDFNFVTGPLDAGSRDKYDKLLDALGVKLGTDGQPFVQIVPRLGDGNAYLEHGSSAGILTAYAGAAALKLGGLETLFANMSAALASPAACAADATGIRRSLATNAQLSMGSDAAVGRDAVAQALCSFFAEGNGGTPLWGSTLLSPTLGKCDFTAASPVCGVSFVLRGIDGGVMPVGSGMGVTLEADVWKFAGDLLPVQIRASAKAQRTKRIDTATPVYDYDRAIAFEVAAMPGLGCAKVTQRSTDGATITLALYKLHPGAMNQQRLALWTIDGAGQGASLDPMVGATRSSDDTWLALPQGGAGDAVSRNFYRGGRTVVVSLYTDAACSNAFTVAGKSAFEIDVEGVPPVWSAMDAMPWPELDATSVAAVRSLAIDATATGSLHTAWTFPRGVLGINGLTMCSSRATCGDTGAGRLGNAELRPGAAEATLNLRNNGATVNGDDGKTLALFGRNGEGVDLQSNYSSCPAVAATDSCR